MKSNSITVYIFMLAGIILAGYYGPWWAPSVFVVLLSGLMRLPAKKAILAGGISMAVVFLAMASWMRSADEADIIGKTGVLMGGLKPVGFLVITTLIGAISGILSGWIGSALGGMFGKD